MLKNSLNRAKSCENILLKPLQVELNNNSKLLLKKNIGDYFKKLKNKQLVKTKLKENKNNSSYILSNKSKLSLNNVNNYYSSLNFKNIENNSVKFNNPKISLMIKNSNSFHPDPKLKSQTFKKNEYLKFNKQNNVISSKNRYLTKNEEDKMDKEQLFFAAYKNNPKPLLESIYRKTNYDKKISSQEINKDSIKDNKKKLLQLIGKKKEKDNEKIKQGNFGEKKIIISHGNIKKSYAELLNNKNISKKIFDISTNKNVEHCMAINTKYLNPFLQNLDDSNYKPRKHLYRSKTENVDDIQNYINIQRNEEYNKNSFLNNLKNTEFNYLDKKSENINNKSQVIENYNYLNNKKKYADASNDTSLDNVLPNSFMKAYNKSLNKIIKTNLKINFLNMSKKNVDSNQNKKYAPKTKIYKYKKLNGKQKHEDKKCNLNVSLKKAVKFYNFNNIINLFGKTISFDNKPQLNQSNNFRKRENKYYSSSNNVKIKYLRKKNFLVSKKGKTSYQSVPQITRDSNMDWYDFEAFFINRL